ncbi:hypothetical protein [Sphingomonas aracearum]|uniref:Uncharacterized protein n=1 Tax=Sphingomonas aracearum TaxID=2283317 RepID=A0A369VXY1_9SPHN|nr:hypothetical protein [Sphingomonas aracearum]RDE04691.1 hypothetical protein DVW87_13965 [Sphingomonas aracearum]
MAISFVGAAAEGGSSVVLPPHQAGDLILVWSYQGTSNANTIPLAPGFTAAAAQSGTGANSQSSRLAYKIAASGAETAGEWTNAEEVIAHVYRGVDPSTPIGGTSTLNATADVTFPAITMAVADGSSWIAAFAGWRTNNTNLGTATFPGLTQRGNIANSSASRSTAFDTAAGVTSFPATSSGGATGFRYRTAAVELRAAATGAVAMATAAATLSAVGIAAAAAALISAGATSALAPIDMASGGAVLARAAASNVFGSIVSTASGSTRIVAEVPAALDAISVASGGEVSVRAAAFGVLAPISTVSAADIALQAVAAPALGAVTLISSAAGAQARTADAAIVLGAVAGSGAGLVHVSATCTPSLGAVWLSGEGNGQVCATFAASLAHVTATSISETPVSGNLRAGFGSVTCTSAATAAVLPAFQPPRAAEIALVRGVQRLAIVPPLLRTIIVPERIIMEIAWGAKGASARVRRAADWSDWLAGDTIAQVQLAPLSGSATVTLDGHDGQVVGVWVEGGTPRSVTRVTMTIETAAGERETLTCAIRCE